MSDTADTIASAITLAAGRMAHGSTDVDSVRRQLAESLRPFFPAAPCPYGNACLAPLCPDSHPTAKPPVSDVDTPARHIEWASLLIGQMSRQRLDAGQHFAVDEALSHLRRAAELVAPVAASVSDGHYHVVDGLLYAHDHAAQEPHGDTREHLRAHRTPGAPEDQPDALLCRRRRTCLEGGPHSGWAGVCDACGSSIWPDLAEEAAAPPEARPEAPTTVSALRTLAEEVDDTLTTEDGDLIREAANTIALVRMPDLPGGYQPDESAEWSTGQCDSCHSEDIASEVERDGYLDERFGDYGTGHER